jgi:hypothetical protein
MIYSKEMLLPPALLNFALDYAIRKVQKNQVGLKMNGTHQLLAYAHDLNLRGDNIGTTTKGTETLIDGRSWYRKRRRENLVYVGVSLPEFRLILDIKITNKSFEKYVTVQVCRNDSNKSKFYSSEN